MRVCYLYIMLHKFVLCTLQTPLSNAHHAIVSQFFLVCCKTCHRYGVEIGIDYPAPLPVKEYARLQYAGEASTEEDESMIVSWNVAQKGREISVLGSNAHTAPSHVCLSLPVTQEAVETTADEVEAEDKVRLVRVTGSHPGV